MDVHELIAQLREGGGDAQEFAQVLSDLMSRGNLSETLRASEHYIQTRVLQNGSVVTADSSGVGRDVIGTSEFDTFNFQGGVAYVNANNPRQVDITVGGGAADCMYDYWVSSCFSTLPGYTAGMAITTFSGCTVRGYATLFGASGALQAALLTGASKAIFMCNSESMSASESLSNLVTGAFIFIDGIGEAPDAAAGSVAPRTTLTATGVSMFTGLTTGYWTGKGQNTSAIVMRHLNVVVTGNSVALFQPSGADGIDRPVKFFLADCALTISGTSSALFTNASGRPTVDYELNRCTGTLTQFYQYDSGAGVQATIGTLTLRDCNSLTVNTLFTQKGASTGYSIPNFYWYDTTINLTAAQQFYGQDTLPVTWIWNKVTINYSGAAGTTAIKFGGVGGTDLGLGDPARLIFDVIFNCTNQNCGLFYFNANNASGAGTAIFLFESIKAYTGSSTSQTTALITLVTTGTQYSLARLGIVLAPQWTTPYSGPTTGFPVATVRNPYALIDGSLITQKTPVGPMPLAGSIKDVTCKTADGVTIGATAWVGTIYKVLAANRNTDGGTTEIFTTRPTITNGNMAQVYGPPDLTTTFAAGDFFVFATTQVGTNATMVAMEMTVSYA